MSIESALTRKKHWQKGERVMRDFQSIQHLVPYLLASGVMPYLGGDEDGATLATDIAYEQLGGTGIIPEIALPAAYWGYLIGLAVGQRLAPGTFAETEGGAR